MDLENIKKIYFIGIKGSGMTALVEVFLKMGKEVVGSDVSEKFFTDEVLKKLGINFYEKFSVDNLEKEKPDLVVHSSVYNEKNNCEMEFAKKNNLPMISYPEVLGALMREKISIAVCGTHGKTTTSAMLALAMKSAGADPTAIIGSRINQIGSNAMVGKSHFLVVEADEYQNKFQFYYPTGVVLTSLDYDHPDFFVDFESYKKAFRDFVKKIPRHGFLVAFAGDDDVIEIAKLASCGVIFYGEKKHLDEIFYRKEFSAETRDRKWQKMEVDQRLNLKIPGRHNLMNATAVLAVCRHLKLDEEKVLSALNEYAGTARRFELVGEYNKAEIVDDYAHHPAEIKTTLKAMKERYSHKNIVCVFRPHTFTRTEALFSDFAQSFDDCDELIVLDIFGSAREKQGGVSSEQLVREIAKYKDSVSYLPSNKEAFEYLKKRLSLRDVLITMGAGDTDELAKKLAGK